MTTIVRTRVRLFRSPCTNYPKLPTLKKDDLKRQRLKTGRKWHLLSKRNFFHLLYFGTFVYYITRKNGLVSNVTLEFQSRNYLEPRPKNKTFDSARIRNFFAKKSKSEPWGEISGEKVFIRLLCLKKAAAASQQLVVEGQCCQQFWTGIILKYLSSD